MYVMVGNKIIEMVKKDGRKVSLKDGSTCDITQIRYFWKKGQPQENTHYLNAYMLREIFRKAQYKEK